MVLSNCLTRGSWLHALSQYSESKIRTDPYNTSSSKKKRVQLDKIHLFDFSKKKKQDTSKTYLIKNQKISKIFEKNTYEADPLKVQMLHHERHGKPQMLTAQQDEILAMVWLLNIAKKYASLRWTDYLE